MNLSIQKYDPSMEGKWDKFVLEKSVNGTFLQTRNFLNYHPCGRFEDASVVIMSGTNIYGVVPAHKRVMDGMVSFCSHLGSTFGGFVIGPSIYSVSGLEALFPMFDQYLLNEGYQHVIMKSTPNLFSKKEMELLDYEYFRYGFNQYDEIAFYLECAEIPEDILSMMTSSRRRDCRYSFKNNFALRRLELDSEVTSFYHILEENLRKFDTKPVHTLEEILEFKNTRLHDEVRFYGVYENRELVSGAMIFAFGDRVFHTQYLACLPEYNRKFAMNFMDYNLIKIAKQEGFSFFSFGTSTGNHGKELNTGLALYKEGFGCSYSVNRTYYKDVLRG